jgi:hypothetical protein
MIMRTWAAAAALLFAFIAEAQVQAQAQNVAGLDSEQEAYVDGNLYFLAYHEVGHMIMDQVLNEDQIADRRASEEIADDIATWLLLPDPDEPPFDADLVAAMRGWMRSSTLQDGVGQSPHYPDDAERAARIACYVYGSNPSQYGSIAQMFPNSINSVNCEEEVEILQEDLQTWFEGSMIPPAEADGALVTVAYGPAGGALAEARDYLMESGVLEEAAEDISQFIRLPNEVRIVGQSCGAGAAEFRYRPSTRQITACYEAVDWLVRDARGEYQEAAEQGRDVRADELGSGGARVSRRPRPPPPPPSR